jgi:hypothetical protein
MFGKGLVYWFSKNKLGSLDKYNAQPGANRMTANTCQMRHVPTQRHLAALK